MSVMNRPDYKIFGQDARAGEMDTFPDILRGWGVTLDQTAGKPPMEWFNALGRRVDEWLLYLTQRGVAEWDKGVDYPKSAIVQHAGGIYVALRPTRDEAPDLSQNSWQTLSDSLGLAGGSALPIGVPVAWPSATPPAGWLKCNGATFDKKKYPALAVAYPSGNLPDLRGEFIRGWDDGRGVDIGRAMLSAQQATKISGQLFGNDGAGTGNAWHCDQDVSHDGWEAEASETMSRTVPWGRLAIDPNFRPTALIRYSGYIRPRSIAFNYIVRAA